MTPALQRLLPGVALGFVIGLVGYALWARLSSEPERLAGANLPSVPVDPLGEGGDPNQDLASQLAGLRAALAAQVRDQQALRSELEALRQQLTGPSAAADRVTRPSTREDVLVGLASGEPTRDPSEVTASNRPHDDAAPGNPRPRFDEVALVAHGIDPEEAAWLRGRFEEIELERLYRQDTAMREGYWMKPRARREIVSLERELRDELGEERYDLILYASGRKNRVVVENLIAGSPAERAGVEPGDVVLRYDDERIFNARELRFSTASGVHGESVPVDILRDGREVRIYLPRGPLGIGLRTESRPPEPHAR